MRAVYRSVVVLALASCTSTRGGFTSGASSERDDGCVTDIVCVPDGSGSPELIALAGVATLVSAATLWQFLQ